MKHLTIPALLIVSACAQPLAEYRPVIDPASNSAPRYEADRAECLTIAHGVQAEYQRRASQEFFANILVGAIAGAALGGSVGGINTSEGAAYGAAAGALANSPHGPDMVQYGPRRVVDRCMADRGHRVLNDIGRG